MAAGALPKVLAVLRDLTKDTGEGVLIVDVRRVAVEAGLSEETARHHLGTLLHRGQARRERHGQRFTYRAVVADLDGIDSDWRALTDLGLAAELHRFGVSDGVLDLLIAERDVPFVAERIDRFLRERS